MPPDKAAVPYFDLTRQNRLLKNQLEPAVLNQIASGKYVLRETVTQFE